jgi:hypothetical protein
VHGGLRRSRSGRIRAASGWIRRWRQGGRLGRRQLDGPRYGGDGRPLRGGDFRLRGNVLPRTRNMSLPRMRVRPGHRAGDGRRPLPRRDYLRRRVRRMRRHSTILRTSVLRVSGSGQLQLLGLLRGKRQHRGHFLRATAERFEPRLLRGMRVREVLYSHRRQEPPCRPSRASVRRTANVDHRMPKPSRPAKYGTSAAAAGRLRPYTIFFWLSPSACSLARIRDAGHEPTEEAPCTCRARSAESSP